MLAFSYRERSLSSLTKFLCLSTLVLLLGPGTRLRAQAEPRYEVVVSKNVMIAMRDGVKLATDIYSPARNGVPVNGKFPTIMERCAATRMVGFPFRRVHNTIGDGVLRAAWICRRAAGRSRTL